MAEFPIQCDVRLGFFSLSHKRTNKIDKKTQLMIFTRFLILESDSDKIVLLNLNMMTQSYVLIIKLQIQLFM